MLLLRGLAFVWNCYWICCELCPKGWVKCSRAVGPERLPKWVTGSNTSNTPRTQQTGAVIRDKHEEKPSGMFSGHSTGPKPSPEPSWPGLFLLTDEHHVCVSIPGESNHTLECPSLSPTNAESSENCFLNGFWDVITFLLFEWILQQPNALCC